jgi:XTP/dITP diphosphohydrolase
MTAARRIVLASTNPHKVRELAEMLGGSELGGPFEVSAASELGEPPPVVEDAPTFAGNAGRKAHAIAAWLSAGGRVGASDLVLADDSGLCVDALDGGPGVHSARFAGPAATDAENNAKLVRELRRLDITRSSAHYACALCLVRVDLAPLVMESGAGEAIELRAGAIVRGRCDGEVRIEARGSGGFGYDPHFWLTDGRTMAELLPDEKARIGHRGDALRRLVTVLPALS